MTKRARLKYTIAKAMRREPGFGNPTFYLRHADDTPDPVDQLRKHLNAARYAHHLFTRLKLPSEAQHYRRWWRACARAVTQLRNIDTDLLPS